MGCAVIKNIILVVSNVSGHNSGRGGHLYTVADHYRALIAVGDVKIVCVGTGIPGPLREFPVSLVRMSRLVDLRSAAKELSQHVNADSVLHVFDAYALLVARRLESTPIVFTKCGGAVTKRYTPAGHPDVVFHAQDYEYYRNRGAPLPGRYLKLIPNRVFVTQALDSEAQFPKCDVLVMRVGRICEKYEDSFKQAIALTKYLRSNQLNAKFVGIGYAEDERVLVRLKELIGSEDLILTDEAFTLGASRHLSRADVVVASGRGAMESATRGKVTLVPAKGKELPVLLDESTLEEGIFHNFSDRSVFTAPPSVEQVLKILRDPLEFDR